MPSTDSLTQLSLPADSSVGFISDLHLSPARPDIERRLRNYLKQSATGLDALIILGDLFEFWIGDDASAICGHEDIEQLLADFSRQNHTDLYLMHGNRDFLLGKTFCEKTGCRLLQDPCVLHIGRRNILLAHGDAYCTDDFEHQTTRQTMRMSQWQEDFLVRTVQERLGLAKSARSRSETGKQSKSVEIMDVNEDAIATAMRLHGSHIMIHGHTHRPAVHRFILDGTPALRVVLSDWFDCPGTVRIKNRKLLIKLPHTNQEIPLF